MIQILVRVPEKEYLNSDDSSLPEEAVEIMKKNNIQKLPVVTDNKIVGIITVTDITKAAPEMLNRLMVSDLNLGID